MPEQTERIEPFRAEDGAVQPLLDFCLEAWPLLTGRPAPAQAPHAEERTGVLERSERLAYRVGGEDEGLAVTREREWQHQTGALVVERLAVSAYGLPEGTRLALRAAREWYAPRYLTLDAASPDTASLGAVMARFREVFGHGNEVRPEEASTVLQSARAAVAAGDWRSAAIFSEAVLAVDPRQADALFYLGVARGAEGDTAAGLVALLLALEVNPRHHDALYNLGVLYLTLGRPAEAAAALEESLRVRPGNHPVFYQLGQAYEALGDTLRAVACYREALNSAPNPRGYWGFRGMDLTEQARQALARLGSA